MYKKDILKYNIDRGLATGLILLAISVGNKESVDKLTERLELDRFKIFGEPRTSGDGYYGSIVSVTNRNIKSHKKLDHGG